MSDWQQSGTSTQETTFSEGFRNHFKEFAHSSPEKFEDEDINFWYDIGDRLVTNTRITDATIRNHLLELFVAHNVLVYYNNRLSMESGDMSGGGSENIPISGNNAGDVSISYDLGSFMEEHAGEYNTTIYGRKFIRLIRMFGIGGAIV